MVKLKILQLDYLYANSHHEVPRNIKLLFLVLIEQQQSDRD